MKFPSNKEIKSMLSDIKDAEPTIVINYKEASYSDVLKYKLCQEFIKVIKKDGISQVELAKRLSVDKSIVNKIVHHKIEHFTIDRLIDLYSSLGPLDISLKAS